MRTFIPLRGWTGRVYTSSAHAIIEKHRVVGVTWRRHLTNTDLQVWAKEYTLGRTVKYGIVGSYIFIFNEDRACGNGMRKTFTLSLLKCEHFVGG